MNINDAWKDFEKTGSIFKYLEYKNLCKEKELSADNGRRDSNKGNKYRGK